MSQVPFAAVFLFCVFTPGGLSKKRAPLVILAELRGAEKPFLFGSSGGSLLQCSQMAGEKGTSTGGLIAGDNRHKQQQSPKRKAKAEQVQSTGSETRFFIAARTCSLILPTHILCLA